MTFYSRMVLHDIHLLS
jgi:PAS domain S-box-containing protein